MSSSPTLFVRHDSTPLKIVEQSKSTGRTKGAEIHLISTLLLLFCLLAGCVHAPAPYRPSSWVNTSIDMKSVADNPAQPSLQVILVYGPWWCHHSALRLVCPDRSVLFWDPGGSYGTSDSMDVRSKDLIRTNPPDLETYLRFTWEYSSVEVEVFEWDVTLDQAHELYDVLLNGTDKRHPAGKFSTATMGGLCSLALSDFLHRFAKKTMNVPKSFFFPHDLARVLYTQSPRRVLAFRRGKQVVYVPP
jgi:hypothetical protein